MKLINLTKRPLMLYDTRGKLVEVPPDPRHIGVVALGEHQTIEDSEHTFSLNVRHVKDIKGMPAPEEGTLYVVPVEIAMVLQEVRKDVAFPAEEAQVRDSEGRLQRVTHLRRIVSRLSTKEKKEREAPKALADLRSSAHKRSAGKG